ncbi:MAG: hypothetical protein HOV81_41650 [Kofleriaceae bacterium]|nr:hypothetical protein [Kofleriaceae bacterium]
MGVVLACIPACSFRTADKVSCVDDTQCVTAFGAGAVCRADGFCEGGTAVNPDANTSSNEPWTFVSFPDFLNADIGDVSALTSAVNSTNAAHEAAIAKVLDALAAEHPDFVMVAGDLVNGHWYLDASGVQVFGPVSTRAQKAAAIDKAADLYYTQWKKRFEDRGLPVYAAVGDHDVGDNNWEANTDKAYLVADYKEAWARHFTVDDNGNALFENRPEGTPYEHTAYAVRHKNVLIVTVDVFRQDSPTQTIDSKTGSVRTEVAGEQLAWLDSVLAGAASDPEIDHVIVQGHVPVLVPVRQQNSSGMTMPGAETSAFWQTLQRNHADLYFAGEVHDMSTNNVGGVEQVVHGGIMGYAPSVNYLVGHVYPDRVELELKRAELVYPADTTRLWQAGSNRPRADYAIGPGGFTSAGTLVLDKSSGSTQYLNRTGYFIPLATSSEGLAVHLPFDEAAGSSVVVNHGTTGPANNGTVTGATFVAGKLGNAVSIDNLDRIAAGAAPLVGPVQRTTSVWINTGPGPGTGNGIRTIFTFGANMQNGTKWDVDIDELGKFELGISGARTDATSTVSLANSQWHHLAIVANANATIGTVTMYLDGEPYAFTTTMATTPINTKAGNLIIGHSANSLNFQQYNGLVDDLAIWGEPLTAAQIRALASFANESTLNYDAGELEVMFEGLRDKQDVQISGRLWRYQASGLTGTPGRVVVSGSDYSVNLDNGAGFVSP